MIIAGARRYLDEIDLGQVTEFERQLLSQIRFRQPEILQVIRTDRDTNPETETLLVSFSACFVRPSV